MSDKYFLKKSLKNRTFLNEIWLFSQKVLIDFY